VLISNFVLHIKYTQGRYLAADMHSKEEIIVFTMMSL